MLRFLFAQAEMGNLHMAEDTDLSDSDDEEASLSSEIHHVEEFFDVDAG